jgi:hypothetical protein
MRKEGRKEGREEGFLETPRNIKISQNNDPTLGNPACDRCRRVCIGVGVDAGVYACVGNITHVR